MKTDLASLTTAQREAVNHVDGPLLILAGPGSGKTRVVTHRVAHLLECGIPSHAILALTFTNKAADEMRGRLERLAPRESVWVSTFHRFGSKLLRHYAPLVGLESHFTIYDADDSRQVLRRVLRDMQLATSRATPQRIGAAISRFKNNLVTAAECQSSSDDPVEQIAVTAYANYQARLLASTAVDFDDLLLHMAVLLRDNAQIRKELDQRFRYILVDEYQDTNLAQYVILRALSHHHPNLAVTGDPDQSIYGWRGANLGNILRFERDFPGVRVVRLEQNWRSTQRILHVADSLISYNLQRKAKRLITANDEGSPVRLVHYATQLEEAAEIADRIAAQIESGRRRPADFAVFYRINALSRTLEMAFSARAIPYQLVHGLEFYKRKEIKDVLAFAMLTANPRDDVAFLRIVNVPPRGIGKQSIDRLQRHATRHRCTLLDAARQRADIASLGTRPAAQLGKFVALIDRITAAVDGPVSTLLRTILDETGYQRLYADSDLEIDLNRQANIEELITAAEQFDAEFTEDNALEAFLEKTALVNDTDDWKTDSDQVTLMTLHAAKGLEFPVVFIIAVEDGLLPHERNRDDPGRLEEERRLLFVGITRAEEELDISHVVQRQFRGQKGNAVPSQFLMELPRQEMERITHGDPPPPVAPEGGPRPDTRPRHGTSATLTTAAAMAGQKPRDGGQVEPDQFDTGMAVTHPTFGPGKIVALDGQGTNRTATVTFPAAGQKEFVLAHSPLRPVGRP